MTILRRRYLRDFFALLSIIALGLSALFSLIDLIGKIDSFSPGSSAALIVSYALLSIPRYLVYLLPMSVLICSLFTFSQAYRRKEMTAIKAAGGRLRTLFLPFIAVGLILSILAFALGEMAVPYCTEQANTLKERLEGKDRKTVSAGGAIWVRSTDGSPVRIDLYAPVAGVAKGMTIFRFEGDLLKEKIVADEARWNGAEWVLSNITRYDVASGRLERQDRMVYGNLEAPDIFEREVKTPDEMGIIELRRYAARLRAAGFANAKLAVDLQSKLTFPLINVFMMLLGISLSSRGRLGGGLVSAGLGLLISLAYWLGYTFTLSAGYAGIAPPLLAAWSVPLIFGAFGAYLFSTIPE